MFLFWIRKSYKVIPSITAYSLIPSEDKKLGGRTSYGAANGYESSESDRVWIVNKVSRVGCYEFRDELKLEKFKDFKEKF